MVLYISPSIKSFGQTANQYTFTTGTGASLYTGAFTNLIGTGSDDGYSSVTNIGFSFCFESTAYTQFSVNANGLVKLGGTQITGEYTNSITSTTNTPKLMAGWDDLNTGSNGAVEYILYGAVPDRVLVIQWRVRNNAESGNYTKTFQACLFEATNVIQYIYNTGTNFPSASIGIGGSTAANYMARDHLTNHTAASTGGLNTIVTWPGSGRYYIFTPPTASYRYYMYNANLGSTSWSPGESRSISISVKNTGTATWTDASPDINVGVKWNTDGSNWADYYYRQHAGSVAPGGTATYTFSLMQASNATAAGTTPNPPTYVSNLAAGSSNNITFDMVNESNCWFGNNPGSCNGSGTATMNVRYVSPTQTMTCPGDETTYGSGSWIGYLYSDGTFISPFTSGNYKGYITETETFDHTFTSPLSGANLCGSYSDYFSIRFKMTKNFTAGTYTFTVGGDDGYRFSVDGGTTWLINKWSSGSYSSKTTPAIYLSGSTNLVFEYCENTSTARASFTYSSVSSCSPVSIPYSQNFDGVSAPALPTCWSSIDLNADGYFWKTATTYAYSSANSLEIIYNSSAVKNDWVFTPPLDLEASSNYKLTFYYSAYNASYPEKLEVEWGTAAYATGSGVNGNMTGGAQLFDNNNLTSTSYAQATCNFTTTAAGTYFIGFHGYSDADESRIFIDDVNIVKVAPPAVTNLSVTSSYNDKDKAITITGTGFTGADDVKINGSTGTSLTGITYVNSTTITATVQKGICALTNAQITVHNSVGWSTDVVADNYTVNVRDIIPVGGGTDYHTTIQSAIDGLWASLNCGGSGSSAFTATKTIDIYPATYNEGVLIKGSTNQTNFNPTGTYRLIIKANSGRPIINASGQSYGIYISDNTDGDVDYVTIQDLEIENATLDGVKVVGGNAIITNNIIHDNSSNNILLYSGGSSSEVSYNKCYGNGSNTIIGIKTVYQDNANIHHNLVYNNKNYGIQIGDAGTATNNSVIKNNTLFNSGTTSVVQTSATYSATGSVSITDNGCPTYAELSLNIPDNYTIAKIEVLNMNITHTYDGDLDIYIKHPDATTIELSTDNGSSSNNYTNTNFSDAASTSITAGTAPFTGTYKPEGLLSDLIGKSCQGTWKLRVCDDASADAGTITRFDIKVYYNTAGSSTGAECYIKNGTGTIITNNIMVAKTSASDNYYALQTATGMTISSSSGYNDYYGNGNSFTINIDGTKYNDLPTWLATPIGNDDISTDPMFVSAGTDFHEKSDAVAGTYTGGSWPPYVESGGTWTRYANLHSPTIDAGDASAYSNEHTNNGSKINQGCYGNTVQASLSVCGNAVDAGPDQPVCGSSTQLNAIDQIGYTGTWSVTSGAGSFTDVNSANPVVSGMTTPGTNVFRWTIDFGSGCYRYDEVSITTVLPTQGGTANPTASPICKNSGSTNITLSGQDGTILGWFYSDDGTNWTTMGTTANPVSSGTISVPRYYRALVQKGSCSPEYSIPAFVDTMYCTAPANDNCAGAITLTPNAGSCSFTAGSTLNATNSSETAPGCANYQGGDVWYKFTTPADGKVIIETEAGDITDGGMAIYSGACGSLVLVECDDNDGTGNMPMIDKSVTPLSGSTQYYIRFWEYGNDISGTFGICVYYPTALPTAPVLHNTSAIPGEPIAFNNCRSASTQPRFAVSASCTSVMNRFQIELNTASNFIGGTAYTQTFTGSYTNGIKYNLLCNNLSPSLPSSEAVYFVRVRASSDGGSTWSSWRDPTNIDPWAYTVGATNFGWHITSKVQFDKGSLVSANYGNYISSNNNATTGDNVDDYVEISPGSFIRDVLNSADDGVYEGAWYPDVVYMTVGYQESAGCGTYEIFTGWRFQNLYIPNGATILTSSFKTYSTTDGQCKDNDNPFNIMFRAHDVDNAPALSSGLPSLTMTTAFSDTWQYGETAWGDAVAQTFGSGQHLEDVVQEIVSRTGWSSGNALTLRTEWDDRGDYMQTGYRHRFVCQRDRGAAYAAQLSGTFTNFTNKIKFPNIELASFESNGGTVSWDKLIFDDETGSCGACDITYYVYNASNNALLVSGSTTPIDISAAGTTAQIYVVAELKRNNSPKLNSITVTAKNSSLLPVELLSFTANCDNNIVELNWSTASEINNDYFNIEKSKDLSFWSNVTTVYGSGTSNTLHMYNATDLSPYHGLSYYRLTQYDYDGVSETFDPVSTECIDISANTFEIVNTTFNEAHDQITVTYNIPQDCKVNLFLVDAIGQKIADLNKKSQTGLNSATFYLRRPLVIGLYIVTIEGCNDVFTQKIFIH